MAHSVKLTVIFSPTGDLHCEYKYGTGLPVYDLDCSFASFYIPNVVIVLFSL